VVHFKHCYAYQGAHCSCGAARFGGYTGDQPGPDMQLPPTAFSLTTRANTIGPWTEE
jgi:hypothetical protein